MDVGEILFFPSAKLISKTTRKSQSDNTHQTTLSRKSVAWKRQTTVNSQHSESIVWTMILTSLLNRCLENQNRQVFCKQWFCLTQALRRRFMLYWVTILQTIVSNPLSQVFGQTTVLNSGVVFRWTITQLFWSVLWE